MRDFKEQLIIRMKFNRAQGFGKRGIKLFDNKIISNFHIYPHWEGPMEPTGENSINPTRWFLN